MKKQKGYENMIKWLSFMLLLCCGLSAAHCEDISAPLDPAADQRKDDVTYGKLVLKTYFSSTTGRDRKCFVLLPPDYNPDQAYPILYLLHGIGGDNTEWMGAKPDVVIGNLIAAGKARNMIVVMPNIRARENDRVNNADIYSPAHFAAFDNFINDLKNDLMPFIASQYKIIPGRENAAIAGLSMGGREALYIGLNMPDTFGSIGAFCPAPGVLPYFAEKGLFETDELKAMDDRDTFIMINAGKTDNVVGDWPKTYSDTLTKNGTNHIFYVTEGGHDFTVWKHGLYHFVTQIFQQ